MKSYLTCAVLLLCASVVSAADNYPKNPNIDILNYVFRIELSDQSDAIKCTTTIDFTYIGAQVLRLDLVNASAALNGRGMKVGEVMAAGKTVEYTHESNGLIIKLPLSDKIQFATYTITYSGIPASGLKIANNKYGDRTFFSDNWPDKGRHWLPIIDHPYDKATCEFIVTAPSQYQVVSNGLRKEVTDLPDGNRLTHWQQSVPIASWLYVLGVARFAVEYVDKFDNKSIETWVYHQDREKGFYDFAVPTRKVLEFYSSYVGPFAYEKLANIQSNSVSGGMEAASAILYSESSVVGDRNQRWRDVVIHEIAHQWFGNAVTEYDWDDVWLSEGFATYFTLLFIEHEYGHDAFMAGLNESKRRVDAFHQKNPTYRIVHDNLSDMERVTSSHTYQKGSWTLHMLRGVIGEDTFWQGIRSYYKKYQNLNASTSDFREAMEQASGKDLKVFFDQWLYKPGALKINATWTFDKNKKQIELKLDQVQADGSTFKMPMQIAIYVAGKNQPVIETVNVDQKANMFSIRVESMPEKIVIDPNSWVLMDASVTKK
jgi:aminopeptidase N